MKTLLLFALILCTFNSKATNYYFSTTSGDDSRTPAAAQNPATPWKTLTKLNSYFNSFIAGDSVLLKRGETFYGNINITKSGTVTAPIIIGSYGAGNKPVITSLVNLTNWVSKGNGIWESYNATLGSTANMVLLNGVEQEMGRYPNSDAPNKGYLNFESHAGKTSITDNDLNSSVNWTGAELVTRPRHWILNRSLITSQAGTKISYTTASTYEPYDNYGYFIQNSINTLDKLGEWYYNPSTKKMSVYFGTYDPSSYTVSAASIDDIIYPGNFSNIVFDNLAVKGANASAFHIYSGSNIKIQSCDMQFSGKTAVLVHGHTNLQITNCTISNSNNAGIDLEYGVNHATIKNNKIVNTAVIAGLIQNGEGTGLGIYSNGDGNDIESNVLHNTGFIGITFYGNDAVIKNNFIDSFCSVKDDGGAIYTHGGLTTTLRKQVIGNIITDGIGAGNGTDISDKRSVTGIYMDANTSNVEIKDNTVTTCDQGILLQSSSAMIVKNNTVYNNNKQLTMIQVEGDSLVRNNNITNNIWFSKQKEQWVSYIMSSADDIALFGRLDSNYYARPIDDLIDIYNYRKTAGVGIKENFELQGWKDKYNKDVASKKSAKALNAYKIDSLTGVNKFIKGGDFSMDIKGVSATSSNLSMITSGMLDGGCLQVTPTARASSIYFKVGAITAGKNYSLSFSIKGSAGGNMSMAATLRQSGFPYGALTTTQSRTIDMSRREYQLIFSSLTSESSAAVVLQVDGLSTYYVDNINFYEAAVSVTNVDDSLRFEFNATNVSKSVALNGNYINAKGVMYSNNIVLQPYTSAILIKTNGGVQNVAPTVSITSPSANVHNGRLIAPASVNITAEASDADGSVTKVDFYIDTTLLGTSTASPYSFIWNNVAPGSYSLTAKATDNNGLVTISHAIIFTVFIPKHPPTVSLTSPLPNTTFIAPATINITADAIDSDGSVAKVEFYNGNNLLTIERKLPYLWNWQNVPEGNYIITAKATDNAGLTSMSQSIFISVGTDSSASSKLLRKTADGGNDLGLAPDRNNIGDKNQLDTSDIKLVPNPATNILAVYVKKLPKDKRLKLSVLSLSGRLIKSEFFNTSKEFFEINVSSLTPGWYLVRLQTDKISIAKPFEKL